MHYKTGSMLKGYTIKDYINKGGFGDVYSAHQPAINRDVAIKVILPQYANTPDFIRRFEAEAQVIARLEHPYIVPLYDYWRDANGAYLVMRLLKGGSLKDLIQQKGALPIEDIATILEQLSQALHIAHRNQIVHRDIKPGNILLDEDGNAYLADFGIAKDHTLSDDVTDPDGVVGSPDYLAPEQARAEPVTPRTDVYSLGVIIYEMLVGEHPFPNLNSIERLFKHLNDPLPELTLLNVDENMRHDLNEVIQKATAKNPVDRYEDVFSLTQAFKDAAQLDQIPTSISLVELLTPREQEVLKMLMDGKTNRQIAEALVVEISTVKSHNYEIYRKLKVKNRRQAIVKGRHLNLIGTDFESLSSIDIENLPEPENPYKGLQAFQAPDSHLFFGREKFTNKLIKRLQEDVAYKRFLAVVGPSGSGKSSVIKAGLIPQIWRGAFPGSDNWYIVDMIPGQHPLDELEIALTRVATDNKVSLHEQLERDERGLWRVADMILPDDGSELLLVIDQFEEVFTLVDDETKRQHFLNLLQTAVTTPRSRLRIVVTLRADFYDKPLQYPEFGELIRSRIETILPLGVEELEHTIREPAQSVGVNFEDGLVSRIVSDVHYQPGALPLLQYALTELFERRNGRTLTLEAYEAIGGTGGALANRADELFLEGDEQHKALIRQMFLRLVTLGEGAEDTRRRVERTELLQIVEQTESMDEIIDLYAESRLLSLDHDPATRQPTVEVAHEAILREWDRLRAWLNDSRDDIRQERLISLAAQAWLDNGQDNSYLLSGSRLEQVELWQASTQIALTPREGDYIRQSIAKREADAHAETERQARETSLEQRSRNFLRGLVAVLTIGLVLAGFLVVIANNERNNTLLAQQDTLEALDVALRSGQTYAALQALEVNEVDLAIALAMESIGDDENDLLPETLRLLERIENRSGPRSWSVRDDIRCGYGNTNRDWSLIPNFDCAKEIGAVAIYSLQTGALLWRFEHAERPFLFSISPDNRQLLTAWSVVPEEGSYSGVNYKLWDIESQQMLSQFTVTAPQVFGLKRSVLANNSLMFTKDIDIENLQDYRDRNILIADAISMRDAVTGELLRQYRFDNIWIQHFDFSDDGQLGVVSGWPALDTTDQYRAIVFDLQTGETLQVIDRASNGPDEHGNSAFVGFTDNDRKVYFSGQPNYVVDLATNSDDERVTQQVTTPMMRPSSDYSYILSGYENNWQIFETKTGKTYHYTNNELFLTGLPGIFAAIDVGRIDILQFWDMQGNDYLVNSLNLSGNVTAISYSPDGRSLATASAIWGGAIDQIIIYDSETLQEQMRLNTDRINGIDDIAPWSIEWSPDGKYLAAGGYFAEASIRLWDVETGELLHRFTGTQDHVMTLKFSNDGRYLYGAHGNLFTSLDYAVEPYLVMWDVATGAEIRRYEIPVNLESNHGILTIQLHPTENLAYVSVNLEQLEGSTENFNGYLVDLSSGEITLLGDFSFGFFTPDGEKIVLMDSSDSSINVFDFPSMQLIHNWSALDNSLFGIALSPNGKYLAAGAGPLAFEPVVNLWDVETGELIRRYYGHADQRMIPLITFHPDSTQFASTGWSDQLIVWDVDTTSTLDWVRENRVVRDFTCAEREQYRIEPLCEVE